MSNANKNHHRKVKHHSSGPVAVQDTTTKNKEVADTKSGKKLILNQKKQIQILKTANRKKLKVKQVAETPVFI